MSSEQLVSVVKFIYMGRTKMTSPLLQVSMATFHKLEENIASNEAENGEIIEDDEREEDLIGFTSSGEMESENQRPV